MHGIQIMVDKISLPIRKLPKNISPYPIITLKSGNFYLAD
jgi:hypothetical protein